MNKSLDQIVDRIVQKNTSVTLETESGLTLESGKTDMGQFDGTSIQGPVGADDAKVNDNNNDIVAGDMEGWLKLNFDEAFNTLALSKSLEDIARAFKIAEERIGKNEFVTAILLYRIYKCSLWENLGYVSLSDFLRDLPDECKVSRQSFLTSVHIGQVLSKPMCFDHVRLVDNFPVTPALFHQNYSKIPLLWILTEKLEMSPTLEIMSHFRDDTVRDFHNFVNGVKAQKRQELEDRKRQRGFTPHSPELKKPSSSKTKNAFIIPVLTGLERQVYDEICRGHHVGFIICPNSDCVASIRQYVVNRRKQEYEDLNRKLLDPDRLYFTNPAPGSEDTPLSEMDWSNLAKGDLLYSVLALTDALGKMSPKAIREVLTNRFRTKTEIRLAEAFIIHRFKAEKNLQENLKAEGYADTLDFAVKELNISESCFKWLNRLGQNLILLRQLDGRIHIASEGFLEKLSYLGTAIKNHKDDLSLVVDALNTQSARRFRNFAKNPVDDLSEDPLTKKDYLAAKPYLSKLSEYLSGGKPVHIIGLKSKWELEWLEKINTVIAQGEMRLKAFYPEIVWSPEFVYEPAQLAA
jgi:hypothetical protein